MIQQWKCSVRPAVEIPLSLSLFLFLSAAANHQPPCMKSTSSNVASGYLLVVLVHSWCVAVDRLLVPSSFLSTIQLPPMNVVLCAGLSYSSTASSFLSPASAVLAPWFSMVSVVCGCGRVCAPHVRYQLLTGWKTFATQQK